MENVLELNCGYWNFQKNLILTHLICNLTFWLYVADKKKKWVAWSKLGFRYNNNGHLFSSSSLSFFLPFFYWTFKNCCSLFLSPHMHVLFLTIMQTLQRKGKAWQEQEANDEEVLLHCPSPLFSPIKHSHPFFPFPWWCQASAKLQLHCPHFLSFPTFVVSSKCFLYVCNE